MPDTDRESWRAPSDPDVPGVHPAVTSITAEVWFTSSAFQDRRDFCDLAAIHTVEMDGNDP